jgi:hypothetical protein
VPHSIPGVRAQVQIGNAGLADSKELPVNPMVQT